MPPTVWSARRLMAANASRSEKIAPSNAATAMVISMNPCRLTQSPAALAASNQPHCCTSLTNSTPMNAPKIMMPSSARLITPLRSAYTPASATTIRGTA